MNLYEPPAEDDRGAEPREPIDIVAAAERSLLGVIAAFPQVFWDVRHVVRPQDFTLPQHEVVFGAMAEVAESGRLPGPIETVEQLSARGYSDRPGYDGMDLFDLQSDAVHAGQSITYSDIVRKNGERHRLHQAGIAIQSLAMDGTTEGDLIEVAAGKLDELRQGNIRTTRQIGEAFDSLLEDMKQEAPFIPTPWYDLNQLIGGCRPGSLVVVGARPGDGKTVTGLQLAHHVATLGHRVGFVSMEMSEKELLKRLIALMASIHVGGLQNHQLTDSAWTALRLQRDPVRGLPLEVLDRGSVTYPDIVAFARALARKGDLKVLVIDYFGLISAGAGGSDRKRHEYLEEIAGKFKQLARDLGITIVVLAQLNRDGSARKTARPMLTDLRGTGALEQDADVVILLSRKVITRNGKEFKTSEIEMIAAKNRQGQPGVAEFIFEGEYARIVQKTAAHEALINEGDI